MNIGNVSRNCVQIALHHQISKQLLIQYFYKGLLSTDKSMTNAASGGALVDKTSKAARNLIANMTVNSQQFGTRLDPHLSMLMR